MYMQCDQTTHMSGLAFEHFKTTYQVLLLPPPPRFHAGVQRALDRCHCITTVASLRPTSPSTPSSRAEPAQSPFSQCFHNSFSRNKNAAKYFEVCKGGMHISLTAHHCRRFRKLHTSKSERGSSARDVTCATKAACCMSCSTTLHAHTLPSCVACCDGDMRRWHATAQQANNNRGAHL